MTSAVAGSFTLLQKGNRETLSSKQVPSKLLLYPLCLQSQAVNGFPPRSEQPQGAELLCAATGVSLALAAGVLGKGDVTHRARSSAAGGGGGRATVLSCVHKPGMHRVCALWVGLVPQAGPGPGLCVTPGEVQPWLPLQPCQGICSVHLGSLWASLPVVPALSSLHTISARARKGQPTLLLLVTGSTGRCPMNAHAITVPQNRALRDGGSECPSAQCLPPQHTPSHVSGTVIES